MKPLRIAAGLVNKRITSDIPLCITPTAAEVIANTVGRRVPETGAKCWGPLENFGIDTVEFDYQGSATAGGAVYSPNVHWGQQRVDYWLQHEPLKLWTGDVHSHPGGMVEPSSKAGAAMGDLGYAEAFFEANEIHQYFAMPIILPAGGARTVPEVCPWIISRDDPHRPLLAELRVCEVSDFPKRAFNPAWEKDKVDKPSIDEGAIVDVFERLRAAGCACAIISTRQGTTLIELPKRFGRIKLTLCIRERDGQICCSANRPWHPFGGASRRALGKVFSGFNWRIYG